MSTSPSPQPEHDAEHDADAGVADAAAVPQLMDSEDPNAALGLAAQRGGPPRERKRVRLACSNCHRGKIKCDGERQCDRCYKKGLPPEECVDFQRKRTACTSCRAVKMKCDGDRPCKRCVKKGKGDECTDIEAPGYRRPRPEHRLKHEGQDGALDDPRPVPYNYEDAAAAAAAYYYPPPWAYPMAGGPWQPYGPVAPHVYHAHAGYGPPPPGGGGGDDERAQYTPALRSSYPGEIPGGPAAGAIDPALDPELLRGAAGNGAAGPVAGWKDILHAATLGMAAGRAHEGEYYAGEEPRGEGEQEGEQEGDGEADGEAEEDGEDGEEKDAVTKQEADEDE